MEFVPGLVLCRRFHDEVVAPLLADRLPGLRYSAALLDGGSELLGLDTERSTDHDWGPRAQVFVADPAAVAPVRAAVADLPPWFLGRPTRFLGWPTARVGVPDVAGDRTGVEVAVWRDWLRGRLGFDPAVAVTGDDWLAVPTQRLAELTGGAVFHDGLHGAVGAVRATLAWYPDDVWRHVLAAGWTRVGQAEHLVGRCAEVGDALGSRLVAARVARDLMRLGLLLHRRWPPYDKWLGSVFAVLPDAAPVVAALADVLGPGDWPARQGGLVRALETVAGWSNATGLAAPVEPTVRPFHGRPFLVLDAPRLAAALRAAIVDPVLRDRPLVGAVDQYVDSVDVLTHPDRVRRVSAVVAG
ncbi:DUF4037 domain-containing protein [Micromonospora rifamycinica]|uniref:Uncharacterized protein n=1 Tax=Micromonospora rifamycinica TaxID=291594 RepID=A0A120F7N5_9ACTN|nr:DUF4037 domain-containing protein [Micromonospora rifamycinica]KWV30452.1 hypothetical protein AWV63_22870 [Micromonospora rifamycinica]SCG41440.1 protein of unknown function [Micromonospora rifamycinica]